MNNLFTFLHASSRRDTEFAHLESRIPKNSMDHLNQPSMTFIKKSCEILLQNVFCVTVFMFLIEDIDMKLLSQLACCICVAIGFYYAKKQISISTEHLQISILVFNGLAYLMSHLVFHVEHKGTISVAFQCIYVYHFYLATLTPSKCHATSVIYTSTALMHLVIAMYRFREVDVKHIASTIFSVRIFVLGLQTNQTRLSQMYNMILENERLATEKQKVVQQFPHPVLIIPQKISGDCRCYSNDQFESKIQALDQEIHRLDQIQVVVKKNDGIQSNYQEIRTLLEYLGEPGQKKMRHSEGLKKNAIIQCKPFCYQDLPKHKDVSNSQDKTNREVSRNFNIKSLDIEWKGVPSVMHVFIDTTDIINLEKARNRIKMQKIMFASASHEFRTPLNAIINSFEIIKSSLQEFLRTVMEDASKNVIQSCQAREHIDLIWKFIRTGSTSSVLLMALVEDILNLSRIDNRTFTTKFEFFKVPELLQEVHSLFTIQCENKGVDLLIECDETLHSCEIRTDCNRIRQVLLNLVSNSSKFTFEGFIKIKVCMVKSLDGSDYLEFRVQDTGTGIKEQDQECLFKLFGVLEDNEDLNPNGCGLGLTISKKYVELLGGDIRCQSVYGEGTEMIFRVLVHDFRMISCNINLSGNNSEESNLSCVENISDSDIQISEEYSSCMKSVNKLPISQFNNSKFCRLYLFVLILSALV
ncbi:unnamed protein product [Moneuplotes crassus]|uniref:histidine kinase n=1 Tax=Euplotes crassus TaxID=5936 RepID=A0AAD2CW39_EUPCR|nr:unnamed protein product [Moneuplotes crassus]